MFKRTRLIIKNRQLQRENTLNREEIDNLEFLKLHCKLLAEDTITKLLELETIERSGYTEERKRQQRNAIYNELRKRNMSIKNELSNKFGSDR